MTRTRSENDVPVTKIVVVSNSSVPSFDGLELFSYTYPQSTKSMTDVETEGFYKRSRDGEIINNPMTLVTKQFDGAGGITSHDNENGYTDVRSGPLFDYYVGNSSLVPGYDLSHETSLDLQAMAKLKAIANIDPTPYSFAEDLAELRVTAGHLFSRANDLKKLSSLFQKKERRLKRRMREPSLKRKFQNAEYRASQVSQLWLEYRFAISPLIRSISDLMEAANEQIGTYPDRLTSRGFEEFKFDVFADGVYDSAVLNIPIKGNSRGYEKVHAGILYTVTNPLRDFRFKYGLRNKDIPVTLWAVVPYSFMVDRVYNVSAALRAITNLLDPSVNILSGWVRTKKFEAITENMDGSSKVPYGNGTYNYLFNFSGTKTYSEEFSYDRTPWSPSFADTIPTPTWVKLVDSFTKAADVVALSHTLVRKGR